MKKILSFFAACAVLGGSAFALPTLTDTSLAIEVYASLQDYTTGMAFIGPDDLLVNYKNSGKVIRITNKTIVGPVLDLPVSAYSERGLLGITLHPNFASNHYVYLYYTRAQTSDPGSSADDGPVLANRVSRFTWNGTALVNETVIIDLPCTPGPNHNGGIIRFGPPNVPAAQQKLFIVIGDLNRDNQTQNYPNGNAPDYTGQILRVNDDGSVPTGAERGPFYDVAGANDNLKILYAYGVRNSYGMDFDPVSGKLWDTENGPTTYDEINLVEPGFNSGWETVMGPSGGSFSKPLVQFGGVGTYSEPEFSWLQTVAPTAIHFARGNGLGAAYANSCFVGANNNGTLYNFKLNSARNGFNLSGDLTDLVLDPPDSTSQIVLGTGFGAITDIITGPDNKLYVLDYFSKVYQIKSTAPACVSGWELYR